jgi:hypothetical protein
MKINIAKILIWIFFGIIYAYYTKECLAIIHLCDSFLLLYVFYCKCYKSHPLLQKHVMYFIYNMILRVIGLIFVMSVKRKSIHYIYSIRHSVIHISPFSLTSRGESI